MRAFVVGLCCAISTMTSVCTSAAEATTASLESVKPWDLDYGVTQCTAMREYGNSDRPVTLAIVPSANGQTYELVIAYKRPAHQPAEEFQGSVDFASSPVSAWALKYGEGKLTLYQFRVSSNEMARARTAPTINFQIPSELDASFALQNMPELIDGLQKCTADLKDYWNFGGEKDGRIAVPPKGNIRSDFSAGDYPAQALRLRQTGTAQYMLLVDEKGSVAGCDVLKPSGAPVLDAMGCVVIKARSKLTPAKDPGGKPIRSTFVTPPVAWRIAP